VTQYAFSGPLPHRRCDADRDWLSAAWRALVTSRLAPRRISADTAETSTSRKNLPTATRGNLPGRASAQHVRLQITSNEGRDAKDARPSWHRRD
jgi:hypothetical protein